LSALIPEGKTPTYLKSTLLSFPVSDDVLLQIWNSREDRQGLYPKVGNGNFENLKEWAQTIGWDEDERLSALIPDGKTPTYLKPSSPKSEMGEDYTTLILILVGIASIAIISYFKFLRKHNS